MGERGAAEGEALLERAGGKMDAAQQLARLEHVRVVAGDEIERGQPCAASRPEATAYSCLPAPPSARSSAPAGNDMQILPPTVAAFQILNESAARGSTASTAAPRSTRPAPGIARARRSCRSRQSPAVGRELERRPAQRLKIDQRVGGDLRRREQPSPAGQPSVALAPLGNLVGRGGALDLGNGVQIHGRRLVTLWLTARQCHDSRGNG